ncbi:hypothetical protein GGR22_001537 [Flavobacterium gossypii]|jgi:hypothetical protein|uniref:DUF4625 domain-containing protein n=1 Tax=Flavobacterium gossypii TaxID=1646119 RepID=A0ABR6DNY9_9FLAO|nr:MULTISPECIES: hypothetical protein [Flavobacterium]MBA9073411.1 hypothetical protein [Flavobacterium gossypii]WDO13868.1 hypothetical protein MH928_04010 [Flavobacterium sp. WW92]
MKKLISILFLAIIAVTAFSSCELGDDDNVNYHFELIPTESAVFPESFILGQTYTIKVYYKRPTSCHFFEGFYYERDSNVRTIAVQTSVMHSDSCTELDEEPVEASFDFLPTSTGSYVFKFYQGKDQYGNNRFLEYEVPVVQQ